MCVCVCILVLYCLLTYVLFLIIPLFNLMFFCYYVLVSLHLPVQVSLFTA